MFKLKLSPQSNNTLNKANTEISVNGSVITYEGTEYNFSNLPDNSEVEAELPAVGKIKKTNGLIEITLMYQYNGYTAEPNQSMNPLDYEFLVDTGTVPCPIVWKPVQEPIDLPAAPQEEEEEEYVQPK